MNKNQHLVKDETGKRYGRLVVLGPSVERRQGRYSYECQCDCGARVITTGVHLRRGVVKSCGCYRADVIRTHCQSGPAGKRTPTYQSWAAVIQRCLNSRCPGFRRYGARGITVCERWHSFGAFLADMGPRPEGTSLDRINNARGYEPGNCRWATRKEQGRNKSDVILTETAVAAMREEMALGARNRDLAPKYGIHNSVVSRIRHQKAWT